MCRDAGTAARWRTCAIEPDRPRASRGRDRPYVVATLRSVTSMRASAKLRQALFFWRQRRQKFILSSRIVSVRVVVSAAEHVTSAGFARRPYQDGATDDVARRQRAEIAAVKAVRIATEDEQVAGREAMAAVPGGHAPPATVAPQNTNDSGGACNDAITDAAHALAAHSRDKLDEIGRLGQISAPIGQPGKIGWKADEHQVAPCDRTRRDPVEPKPHTGCGIPDESGRCALHGWD